MPEFRHVLEIVVHLYGSLRGLRTTYLDASIIDQREEFEQFVRGFDMVHPLCNLVNAGNGKECSDDKIRGKELFPLCRSICYVVIDIRITTEVFKLHIGGLNCNRNFFGGSADNGYVRMLGLQAGNDSISKGIIILEGPPFTQGLSLIVDNFRETSFSEIF